MDKTKLTDDLRSFVPASNTFLGAFVNGAAELSEHAVQGAFDLGRSVRAEAFHVATSGVDRLEALHGSAVRVLRDALARGDRMSMQAMETVEAAVRSLTRGLRAATDGARGEADVKSAPVAVSGVTANAA